LAGEHFFLNATTPFFDLNVNPADQLGTAAAMKVASSSPPTYASKGRNGVGDGAVAWLYLRTVNGTTGPVKAVYGINTAGGNPPKTCHSSPAVFSVQYAAEYWFYD
jgi:hypothetical protein